MRYGTHDAVLAKYKVRLGSADPHPLSSYIFIMYPLGKALLVVDVGGTMLGYALQVDV